MLTIVPGQVFLHYKGGRYFLVGVAETHNHNGDKDAVYLSLTTGLMVTRPLTPDSRHQDAFTDQLEWPDGRLRSRFMPICAFTASELERLGSLWLAQSVRAHTLGLEGNT